MGADIHMYLERWTNVTNKNCPRLKSKSEIRDETISSILDEDNVSTSVYRWESDDIWTFDGEHWEYDSIYWYRNYRLFAFLADVRNGGDIEPLDYPRGIPQDASEAYLWACDGWGWDAHSHSWFLVSELLQVDKKVWKELGAENFIEKIESLSGEVDNLRICFFFDN